ncbi:MAG: hypothetical protein ACOYB8_01590 [Eubacteriaceae bacterium]|jgi:UDPglucose 6-dehydrogenase
MKIGIIGMTVTGLSAGAALALAGFDTVLFCPDDEESAEFLEGNLPVHEQGLAQCIRKAAESGKMCFVQRMEPALETDLVLFAERLLPDPALDDALRFLLRDIETASRKISRPTQAAVLTCMPPGSFRILAEHTHEICLERESESDREQEEQIPALVLSLMPCTAEPGKTAEWFACPVPAVIGSENPESTGLLRELLRKTGASRKRILTGEPEQVESAVWLKKGLDLTLKLFASQAHQSGVESLFTGLCRQLKLPQAEMLPSYENLNLFSELLEQPLLEDALEEARFQNDSYINGILETLKEEVQRAGIPSLENLVIAITGLAQYPGSGDMRGAAQLQLLEKLAATGAVLRIYVPEGTADLKWRLRNIAGQAGFFDRLTTACEDARVLILAGNLKAGLNLTRISDKMQQNPILIDPFGIARGRSGEQLFSGAE